MPMACVRTCAGIYVAILLQIFHSFHQEVKLYQQHWWRCDGPCQKRPPYFGMVKRAMNRAPGPSDFWWAEHQASCGGRYVKVQEPAGFSEKKAKQTSKIGNFCQKFISGNCTTVSVFIQISEMSIENQQKSMTVPILSYGFHR
jgi:hypothetical protein